MIQFYKLHWNPTSHVRILIRYYNTVASHTFCKEEGSGHAAADNLSLRNAIIEQCSLIKWWHPLNMWRKCYSMSMDAIYGFHGSQQVFAVATTHWLRVRLQTLSVKGVACEANTTRPTCYICTGIEGSYDKISLVCCFQDVNHAAHNTTIQTASNSWYSLYHGDTYMDRCSSD